jgi:hypothetical protein
LGAEHQKNRRIVKALDLSVNVNIASKLSKTIFQCPKSDWKSEGPHLGRASCANSVSEVGEIVLVPVFVLMLDLLGFRHQRRA